MLRARNNSAKEEDSNSANGAVTPQRAGSSCSAFCFSSPGPQPPQDLQDLGGHHETCFRLGAGRQRARALASAFSSERRPEASKRGCRPEPKQSQTRKNHSARGPGILVLNRLKAESLEMPIPTQTRKESLGGGSNEPRAVASSFWST